MLHVFKSLRPNALFYIIILIVVANAIWGIASSNNDEKDDEIILNPTPSSSDEDKNIDENKNKKPLSLKVGKAITVGKKKYPTIQFGDFQWLAKNLDYQYPQNGTGYYKIPGRKGKLKEDKKMGMLFEQEAARIACESIGMELPTKRQWIELLTHIAPNTSDLDTDYSFNRIRAFGLLMNNDGKFQFNGELAGVKVEWLDDNFIEYVHRDSIGLYWTSEVNENGFPTYLLFDGGNSTITLMYSASENYLYSGSCRCIKDSRPKSQRPIPFTRKHYERQMMAASEN